MSEAIGTGPNLRLAPSERAGASLVAVPVECVASSHMKTRFFRSRQDTAISTRTRQVGPKRARTLTAWRMKTWFESNLWNAGAVLWGAAEATLFQSCRMCCCP